MKSYFITDQHAQEQHQLEVIRGLKLPLILSLQDMLHTANKIVMEFKCAF